MICQKTTKEELYLKLSVIKANCPKSAPKPFGDGAYISAGSTGLQHITIVPQHK